MRNLPTLQRLGLSALMIAVAVGALVPATKAGENTSESWPGFVALAGVVLLGFGMWVMTPKRTYASAGPASFTAGAAVTSTGNRTSCAYCGESMVAGASKCPHCAGEYLWCKRDNAKMPVTTKMKWVGMARGGSLPSHRCQGCGRVIGGAKW